MYQFFVEDCQVHGQEICLSGSDHNHIKNVLRMRPGEKIRISTDSGRSYFCHIGEITAQQVTAQIDAEDTVGTELANRIILFQGLPKGDKMELIVQKATELGVSRIVPVSMKNCVVRLDAKKAENRKQRWQAIAESAAKQSKRTVIPIVESLIPWSEAVRRAQELDQVLVPYENERGMAATRECIRAIRPGDSVGIMIGPEGGFASSEIDCLPEEFHRVSLGRRILRTETAGLAALSMLVYELDE